MSSRPDPYLSRHRILETRDLDEARDVCSRVWERHRSVMRRGQEYDLLWNEARFGKSILSYLETDSELDILCEPMQDWFHISLHEDGAFKHWSGSSSTVSSPNRAVLHVPGQELRLHTAPARILLLSINGKSVRNAAQQRFGDAWNADAMNDWSMQLPSVAALQDICRYAARQLDRSDRGLFASPASARALERLMTSLLLDLTAPDPGRGQDDVVGARSRALVCRVEDWISDHYGEAVAVEDMAAVANISVRALQNAFRRVRDCTPMEALTTYRLRQTRELLLNPSPQTSVTQVATDCGFFHFSRFAGRYAQTFGEKPSQTLQRARRARDVAPSIVPGLASSTVQSPL